MKNRIYLSAVLVSMIMAGCEYSDTQITPVPTPTPTPIGKPLSMSIFHINDTHSHIDSERLSFALEGKETYYYTGGYPRIVSKVKELKNPQEAFDRLQEYAENGYESIPDEDKKYFLKCFISKYFKTTEIYVGKN